MLGSKSIAWSISRWGGSWLACCSEKRSRKSLYSVGIVGLSEVSKDVACRSPNKTTSFSEEKAVVEQNPTEGREATGAAGGRMKD